MIGSFLLGLLAQRRRYLAGGTAAGHASSMPEQLVAGADYVDQLTAELARAFESIDCSGEWRLSIEVRRSYTPSFKLKFTRPEPSGFPDIIDEYSYAWNELHDAAETVRDVRGYAAVIAAEVADARRRAVDSSSRAWFAARPSTIVSHGSPPPWSGSTE